MNSDKDSCILFFAKWPVEGRVKTRLAAEIGDKQAVELYKLFIKDLTCLLESLDIHFKFCFDPSGAKHSFEEWLGKQYCYTPQIGINLGKRLEKAFFDAFEENFSKVVAIGSDSPDLPADFLKESFVGLDSHDAVIGPCCDGGYYLIGFSKNSFLPEVFDNISWSSDSVFEQTVCILKRHRRNVCLLPLWHDVDTPADLQSLVLRTRNTVFEKSRTYIYLMADGLWSRPNV